MLVENCLKNFKPGPLKDFYWMGCWTVANIRNVKAKGEKTCLENTYKGRITHCLLKPNLKTKGALSLHYF